MKGDSLFEQGGAVFAAFGVFADHFLIGEHGPGVVLLLIVRFTLPEQGVGNKGVLWIELDELGPHGLGFTVFLGIERFQGPLVQGAACVAGRLRRCSGRGGFRRSSGGTGFRKVHAELTDGDLQVFFHLSHAGHEVGEIRSHLFRSKGPVLTGFQLLIHLPLQHGQLDPHGFDFGPQVGLSGAQRGPGFGDFFLQLSAGFAQGLLKLLNFLLLGPVFLLLRIDPALQGIPVLLGDAAGEQGRCHEREDWLFHVKMGLGLWELFSDYPFSAEQEVGDAAKHGQEHGPADPGHFFLGCGKIVAEDMPYGQQIGKDGQSQQGDEDGNFVLRDLGDYVEHRNSLLVLGVMF